MCCVVQSPESPELRKYNAPVPDDRIDWFKAEIDTAFGKVSSRWWHENGRVRYEIETPVDSVAVTNGKTHELSPDRHIFRFVTEKLLF